MVLKKLKFKIENHLSEYTHPVTILTDPKGPMWFDNFKIKFSYPFNIRYLIVDSTYIKKYFYFIGMYFFLTWREGKAFSYPATMLAMQTDEPTATPESSPICQIKTFLINLILV